MLLVQKQNVMERLAAFNILLYEDLGSIAT